MSKHHHKPEEIKREPVVNEVTEKDLKDQPNHQQVIEELKAQIQELTNTLASKNKHIDTLQNEIKIINADYVNKITAKANEANILLKNKIDELTNRSNVEIASYKKYAIEKDAIKIIDIVNQFELALSYVPKDEKILQYQSGFKMFLTMFKSLLNDLNIIEIPINIGDEFNPNTMECIEFVHSDEISENKVVKIITKGYRLHDRIIKVATVNIASKKNLN